MVNFDATTCWTAIIKAQDGSEEAWRFLLERYRPIIESRIHRWFPNEVKDLADEFIARKFFRLLIPGASKEKSVLFRKCLGRTIKSFMIDECRRRKNAGRLMAEAIRHEDELTPGFTESPAENLDLEIAQAIFTRAACALRTKYAGRYNRPKLFVHLLDLAKRVPAEEIKARRI